MDLAPPQIMSLAHLNRYATVDEALAAARQRPPPTIQPEPFIEGDGQGFCYPGDARHRIRDRALPGPTRLYRRGRHFLPLEGFEALLA